MNLADDLEERPNAPGPREDESEAVRGDSIDRVAQRTCRRRRILAEVAVLGFLGFLVVVFFWPVFRGQMFSTIGSVQNGVFPWAAIPNGLPAALQDDSATLSHGWQSYLTDSLAAGSFPFWGADSFGGYALFSNGSSGFANPIRIALAATVEPVIAHEIFSILHMAAGGVLAYLLGKDLRLSRWSSLLVGTAWMLASWNLGWLHLEVVSPVVAFFPAGLLLMRRATQRSNPGWAALAGIVMAWSLVSTHLLFAMVTFMLCVLYGAALVGWPVLSRGSREGLPTLAGRAWRLVLAIAISIGLAAPVLLPTWRMLAGSERESLTYDTLRERWLGEPQTFLRAFTPPPLPLSMTDFNSDLLFVGTLVAILAVVGLLVRGSPAAALGRALGVGLFLVIVGTPLTWVVFTFVPGMDVFRPYERLGMWWALAVILLGGAGLDSVLSRTDQWRPWVRPMLAGAVVGFTALQLLSFGRSVNPEFQPRASALAFPDTPLTSAMQQESVNSIGWPNRHAGVRGSQDEGWSPGMLFANTNLAVGLDSITGYDSAFPGRSTDVVRVLDGESVESVLSTGLSAAYAPLLEVDRARLDLLQRLGISQVALTPGLDIRDEWAGPLRAAGGRIRQQGEDGTFVQLNDAGPRLVGGTKIVNDRADSLGAFTAEDFDHTQTVVIEAAELQRLDPRTEPPLVDGPAGTVLRAERNVNDALVLVDAERAAWLVVPDGWDSGWSATVNGRPATVLQANHYQRAVLVPAGESEVRFEYRPDGWSLGVAISLLTVVLGALVVIAYSVGPSIRERYVPHRRQMAATVARPAQPVRSDGHVDCTADADR